MSSFSSLERTKRTKRTKRTMRIIAGKFKGRVITMPSGIRPTADKVREALFEILKARLQGASFLDLYCGSGAVGIEAFSRGAKSVTFVDNDVRCIRVLKKNLTQLGIEEGVGIYKQDALKVIPEFERQGLVFDIIFLDPPYYKGIAKNTLIELSNCDILTRNNVIIVELYKKEALPEEVGGVRMVRTYNYGDTKVEFFGRNYL